MEKSFKFLINIQEKLPPNIYEFLNELETVVQLENGQFVYDEKDEDKIKNLINKFLPSENQ